jgi:hypothetical protein
MKCRNPIVQIHADLNLVSSVLVQDRNGFGDNEYGKALENPAMWGAYADQQSPRLPHMANIVTEQIKIPCLLLLMQYNSRFGNSEYGKAIKDAVKAGQKFPARGAAHGTECQANLNFLSHMSMQYNSWFGNNKYGKAIKDAVKAGQKSPA